MISMCIKIIKFKQKNLYYQLIKQFNKLIISNVKNLIKKSEIQKDYKIKKV